MIFLGSPRMCIPQRKQRARIEYKERCRDRPCGRRYVSEGMQGTFGTVPRVPHEEPEGLARKVQQYYTQFPRPFGLGVYTCSMRSTIYSMHPLSSSSLDSSITIAAEGCTIRVVGTHSQINDVTTEQGRVRRFAKSSRGRSV